MKASPAPDLDRQRELATGRRVRRTRAAARQVRARPTYVVEVEPTEADPKVAAAVLAWLRARTTG